MTPEEFKKYKKHLNDNKIFVPEEVYKYIEELEIKAGLKKVIYTVHAIYQHDMDVEHRLEYQGADPDKAFKECYRQVKDYIEDEKMDYLHPFASKDSTQKYTGLEIKKIFIDMIKNAIDKKHSAYFNFKDSAEWGVDWEGDDEAGFVLEIKEI